MIRIRYTFNSASDGVRWGDFLTSCVSVEGALKSFAGNSPKFMLQNLVEMHIFEINNKQHQSRETLIQGVEKQITEFIKENKEKQNERHCKRIPLATASYTSSFFNE